VADFFVGLELRDRFLHLSVGDWFRNEYSCVATIFTPGLKHWHSSWAWIWVALLRVGIVLVIHMREGGCGRSWAISRNHRRRARRLP